MSSKHKHDGKVSMDASDSFGASPFDSLSAEGLLPAASAPLPQNTPNPKELGFGEKIGQGDRLEVRREKSGRGGKTVTTIAGFPPRINAPMRASLLKRMKRKLGTGGTWNRDCMELQGDKRSEVVSWLSSLGFKPVLAGG